MRILYYQVHKDADRLVKILRNLRRQADIDQEVSVVRDIKERELRIYTDYGRICRPLFIVNEDQRLVRTPFLYGYACYNCINNILYLYYTVNIGIRFCNLSIILLYNANTIVVSY